MRGQLNEQAMHFELLLNRLAPEILRERMDVCMGDKEREEILADDDSVFHRILKAKGLFKEKPDDNGEEKENKVDAMNRR